MKELLKNILILIIIGGLVLLGLTVFLTFCEGWYMTGRCN